MMESILISNEKVKLVIYKMKNCLDLFLHGKSDNTVCILLAIFSLAIRIVFGFASVECAILGCFRNVHYKRLENVERMLNISREYYTNTTPAFRRNEKPSTYIANIYISEACNRQLSPMGQHSFDIFLKHPSHVIF